MIFVDKANKFREGSLTAPVQDDGDQLSVLALKCFPALGPASCEEAGDKVGNTHFNTTLTQRKRGKWTLMC